MPQPVSAMSEQPAKTTDHFLRRDQLSRGSASAALNSAADWKRCVGSSAHARLTAVLSARTSRELSISSDLGSVGSRLSSGPSAQLRRQRQTCPLLRPPLRRSPRCQASTFGRSKLFCAQK